jgi:hypothetical protein
MRAWIAFARPWRQQPAPAARDGIEADKGFILVWSRN